MSEIDGSGEETDREVPAFRVGLIAFAALAAWVASGAVYRVAESRGFDGWMLSLVLLSCVGLGLLFLAIVLGGEPGRTIRGILRWPGRGVFLRTVLLGLLAFVVAEVALTAALPNSPWQQGAQALPGAGTRPGVLFVFVLVLTAIEELLFRGVGVVWLSIVWPRAAGAAVVLTSILFGLAHGFSPAPFVLYGVLGVVLAVVAKRAESALPSLTIHLTVNGVVAGAVLFG